VLSEKRCAVVKVVGQMRSIVPQEEELLSAKRMRWRKGPK